MKTNIGPILLANEYCGFLDKDQESNIDSITYVFDINNKSKEYKKIEKAITKYAKSDEKRGVAEVVGKDTRGWFTKLKDTLKTKKVSDARQTREYRTKAEEREEFVVKYSNPNRVKQMKETGYKNVQEPRVVSARYRTTDDDEHVI